MNKKYKRYLLAVLLYFSLSLAVLIPCHAQSETKVVRIGYTQLQGFLYEEDGKYKGLAYELLEEIASYNNWTYEFTECGYSEAKELFEEDKIDLFLPYQKTEERMKEFEYSEEVFCTNKASLLTLPDSKLYYNDFEDMDGCTIGVVQNTRNGTRFQEYLQENGCQVTLKQEYLNQSELLEAVQNGEIDAFISASNRGISNCKIIAVLPQTESYVIAPKGNRTFLSGIDLAFQKIDIENPNLRETLNEKYQIPEDGTSSPALSKEEASYIQEKKKVTVLISSQECDDNQQFTGSAKILFDNISSLTGLEFVPIIGDSVTEILEDVSNGKADIMYAFNHDFEWADSHNAWLTRNYADFYNKLVTRKNQSEIRTIAVVPGTYIAYYVQNNMNYKILTCDSYESCIDAVQNGKADATYCNSPIGNYYSTFPKYKKLSFLTAYDFESAYCMAVSKSSDQILMDILNKALLCIPGSTLSSAYEVQVNSKKVDFTDVFYSNTVVSVVGILVVAAILLSLIYTLIYMRSIKKKNEQLAIANHAKTDFMARMSHDMRTPMNGILGLTYLSKEEPVSETVRNYLEQIELSGKFLLDLINDTLDMNKMESGNLALHLKPINSEEVFRNVLTNAKIMADEKNVQINLQVPTIPHDQWVPVMADASRLEQVLFNVISNAIKFTPAGGQVDLIMETLSVGEGMVHDKYLIRDHGIGMSEEFLPHLFEAFSQEDRNSESKDQGTGLGMPIVKQLVELMGSQIEVKSKINQGTEVTLYMNYQIYDGEISEKQSQTISYGKIKGKRILLCEDHPVNAQIAVKLLEKYGAVVDVAENGQIGLDKFQSSKENAYACILVDIRMPVMDGLEAARRMRALKRKDAGVVPIIAMTANAFEGDVQNCRDAGMNDHLAKPLDVEKMYVTICRYIK